MTKPFETKPFKTAASPSAAATPEGYMPGFGNGFETEALPGALPIGQNALPGEFGGNLEALQGLQFVTHFLKGLHRSRIDGNNRRFASAYGLSSLRLQGRRGQSKRNQR